MKSQKKTIIDVSHQKIHPYLIALAAVAIVAFYAGFRISSHARGVIPLSTRIADDKQIGQLETIQGIQDLQVKQIHQELLGEEIVLPQREPEAELLDLLRNSITEQAVTSEWKVVRMRVTAYCTCRRCCGKFSDGRTANMHKVRQGDVFVAADKRIPFGTEMIIPGYNQERPVEVKDRGRVIKGNRLDVFFNDHKVAKKWGTRYLDVLVKVEG